MKRAYPKYLNQSTITWLEEQNITVPRANEYTCPNGHKTVTRDVDLGVTPFMHVCATCGSDAYSSFYQTDAHPDDAVEEWYRPGNRTFKHLHPATQEHCLQGGLLCRPVQRTLSGPLK